jgi:hypothetical protein
MEHRMANLSRRSLVTTAAALPALAMPAVAIAATGESDDPVFAAIEKARATHKAFMSRCLYEDSCEEAGIELAPAPDDHRTSEMAALVTVGVNARWELAETVPTTLAGLAAVLAYVVSESDGDDTFYFDDSETIPFVRSIERCVRTLAVQS